MSPPSRQPPHPCRRPRGRRAPLGLRGGAGDALEQRSVYGRVQEARVGVSVHERVDLELRVVEGVRGRLLHLAVDDLPHPRVQAHLGGRERNGGGGRVEGPPTTKPQSQHPPLHRLSWEIGYQRGTVARCGETTACSTLEYMCTGARVFWRELRRGLWVLPVSPCWAEGGGMGCSPPGCPHFGGML